MENKAESDLILREKYRVTLIGAVINIFLTVIKIGFGILGQSSSLIADGVHSLSDLASDFLVVIAIKLGSREPDYGHPYGHRRYETMATILLGLGLIVVAVGIVWDAYQRLANPDQLLLPTQETFAIALISILANEWLYQYTKRIGEQTRSKLLQANAWHHRSDALSSVVVLLGIGAVFLGFPYADALAAILVGFFIIKMGTVLVLESMHELVDSSLPEEQIRDIRKVIKLTTGVRSIHLLRTRQMGEDAYVDAHIVVDPRITVSEGHLIGDRVRDKLKQEFDNITDVLVHVDPEDDEFKMDAEKPLSRKRVQEHLEACLGDDFRNLDDYRIHYLESGVELELILPYQLFANSEQLTQMQAQCRLLEQKIDGMTKVSVFLRT
jgi:cation diffusion facilitator family transporter